jgi:hypothetical protein
MHRRQEYDRRVFLDTAKKYGGEIGVFTDTRIMPRVQGNAVVMQPVILLRYVLSFKEEGREQRWIFEELVDDNGGPLDISHSILDDIYKDNQLVIKVSDPTMTLPRRPQEVTAMVYKKKLLDWRAAHPGDDNKFFGASMLQTRLGVSSGDARRLITEWLTEGWIVPEETQGHVTYRLKTDG